MSISRRTFLGWLGAAGFGTTLGNTARAASNKHFDGYPNSNGVLFDNTRCIGCQACVTACKTANNMPGNLYDPPNDLNGDTKNIIKLYEGEGEYSYMKQQCMHCIDPCCANACMIGALAKREYGIVTWDGDKCIGCRYCQVACPFTVPKFQWDTPTPEIVKCEMCLHLIQCRCGRPAH